MLKRNQLTNILNWGDLLEKDWPSTPIFLPGEFHGQRSLLGYSTWGHKELDMTEQLSLPFFFFRDDSMVQSYT